MEIRHERACGETHFNCRCGAFQMPFGKHFGKTLSQIDLEDRGRNYLEWMLDNLEPGRVRSYIESYLTRYPNEHR